MKGMAGDVAFTVASRTTNDLTNINNGVASYWNQSSRESVNFKDSLTLSIFSNTKETKYQDHCPVDVLN